MYRGPILIMLAALLFVPARAAAQSQWEQQVLEQIRIVGTTFAPEGYSLVGETRMGSLNDGASEDFNLTLEAGVNYLVLGVCDNDCPDIDLMLLDASGSEVGSDYQEDAYPMVEVTPGWTASYQVHVYMADCDAEPCFYGVGLFAAAAGAASNPGGSGTQTYSDRLEAGDDRLAGQYLDTYSVHGTSGERLVADLFSTAFDTYLLLVSPSGEVTDNDDHEGSTNRSRIDTVLDESGEWTVVVTSYSAGETGAYQLSVSTGDSTGAAIATKRGL